MAWVTENNESGTETDIYLYHEGATQRITNDAYLDIAPKVNSNGELAWLTISGPEPGVNFFDGIDIMHLGDYTSDDLALGPENLYMDLNNGGHVVWNSQGDIFLFDGTDSLRLTNTPDIFETRPSINTAGDIVWESADLAQTDSHIEFFDSSGSEPITQLDTDDTVFDRNPKLADNGDVVWVAGSDPANPSIIVYDASASPPPPPDDGGGDPEPPPVHPPNAVELQEAEPVVSNNDIPPPIEPSPEPSTHGLLWSMQTDGTLAQFNPGTDGFNKNIPTVVLVHGWTPDNINDDGTLKESFPEWVSLTVQNPNGTADMLGKRTDINVLAWNWLDISSTSYEGLPKAIDPNTHRLWPGNDVLSQGRELTQSLRDTFGDNYKQPIQFIGHSLGGGVATFAGASLDRFGGGDQYTVDQITLFDVPEVDQLKILPGFNRNSEVPPLYLDYMLDTAAYQQGIWIDNYPTIFGWEYESDKTAEAVGDIVNFDILGNPRFNSRDVALLEISGLLSEFFSGEPSQDRELAAFLATYKHGYPIDWYFGVNDTSKGTLASTGEPNKELGAYLSKVLNRSQSDHDIDTVFRQAIGTENTYVAPDPNFQPYTLVPLDTPITWGFHREKVELGLVDRWVRKGDVYFLNGTFHMATTSPVFLFREYDFPTDSRFLTFDFWLENPSPEDEFLFLVDNDPLFRFRGDSFNNNWNDFLNSGPVDVSEYAGTHQWLTFLYDSEEKGHRAQIANINLYRFEENASAVPEPSTLLLLGVGMIGTIIFRSRSKSVFS